MATVRAQVEIQSAAGMPKDVIVNRFHFTTPGTVVEPAEITEIDDRVKDFYADVLSTTRILASRWPITVAQNGHVVKLYRLEDPKPRVPISTTVFNLATAPSQTGLPDEVALVLSFQGARVSGISPARRRNRIFFGPITTASAVTTANETRPGSPFIQDLLAAADEKLARNTLNVTWVVRSELTGLTTPVTDGWVDNAFDIQRRRGPISSSRTTFAV